MKSYPPSGYNGHVQVYCGVRGPEGGMWFGTADFVLHRYGGGWEKIFTRSGMSVHSMDVDDLGRIWVGGSKELGYLRPVAPDDSGRPSLLEKGAIQTHSKGGAANTGDFEYVSLRSLLPDTALSFNSIWKIHANDERVIFNGHTALFRFNGDSIDILHPQRKFFGSHEFKGRIWVQDAAVGLFRLNDEVIGDPEKDPEEALEKLPGSKAFSRMGVMRILEPPRENRSDHEALIFTRQRGIYRYRYGEGIPQEERIADFGRKWHSLYQRAGIYHAIPLERSKNPWNASYALSTVKKGVILIDTAGRPLRVLDQDQGMSADFVWRTIKGAPGSGRFWSTTNRGVTRWEGGDPRTYAREGKAFSGTVSVIERFKDRLLVATQQGVHYRKKGEEGLKDEWGKVPGTNGNCLDLIHTGKRAEDPLLLLKGGSKIMELRSSDEGAAPFKAVPFRSEWESVYRRLYRLNGVDGMLAYGNDGLALFSERKRMKRKMTLKLRGLPDKVVSLEEGDPKDPRELLLWLGLGTQGAIELRLDKELVREKLDSDTLSIWKYGAMIRGGIDGVRVEAYTGEGKARKGLPPGPVRFFELKGEIVAGTDSGLYRLEGKAGGKEPSFVPDTSLGPLFTKGYGDPTRRTKGIFRLKEGRNGSVWISSGSAYHLKPKKGGGYRIDSVPFKGMELGPVRSILPEKDGITWLGGDNGLVRYDPSIPKNFDRDYPCRIRKVSLPLYEGNDKRRDSLLFGGAYREAVPNDPLLGWKPSSDGSKAYRKSLPYALNGISFHFEAPYFEEQERVRYSYRLKGFEGKWSQWTKRTRKEYTSLAEGSYCFQVKARNVYGTVSRTAEFRFIIQPPWYRTWTAYMGYGIGGAGLVWLLLWLNSRRLLAQKQRLEQVVEKRTKEIQEEKEKVEEAHAEITQSIDYARKIQQALLRSEDEAAAHLPEHFILFKPQAQVSGDFYWFKEHRGHLYVAAVDCTGHGVPGAFMSMLGISQLNEIMSTDEELSPGQILSDLRERVIRELSGSDPDETAKDGMDAAMVKIPLDKAQDPNSKFQTPRGENIEVQFAGAQNPLYVVRKGIGEAEKEDLTGLGDLSGRLGDRLKPFKKSPDGVEVKGDPMPVGYDEYASGDFNTVSLQIQKGDMLYIFSDGYADQFGGEKGKKFRYGPFKQLLAEIHEKPMEEQKQELDRVFEEWKADREQIDDVLVIGIRI